MRAKPPPTSFEIGLRQFSLLILRITVVLVLLVMAESMAFHRPFGSITAILAIELIRQTQKEHDIQDTIVVLERTGNYHLPPKRAFASAGFETRIVHPFATKQYRVPADPGIKTDHTDLYAQHRAAVAGFGLCDFELESPYR